MEGTAERVTLREVSTLADVQAIEDAGWPVELPGSTYALLQRGAAIDPSAPALTFFRTVGTFREPRSWTYGDLLREITRTANGLNSLGIDADTVIAYVLPNLPETHFVLWGAEAAGIVFPINPQLAVPGMRDLMRTARVQVLVTVSPATGSGIAERVAEAVREVETVRHIILVDTGRRDVEAQPGAGKVDVAHLRLPAKVFVHDFALLRIHQPDDHLTSGRAIDPRDVSSYFGTGGTTGQPKIAVRTHGNEVANAFSTRLMMSGIYAPGKNLFCGLPMFHVNAVHMTGLVPLSSGAHVILGTSEGYRADGLLARFWEIVEHYRINFISGVPTIFAGLLEHPTEAHDLTSLEYGLCGAAPLPVEMVRRFEATTGIKILEGYGLTESVCVATVNPPGGERRPGAVGIRIPFEDVDVVTLDEDDRFRRNCEPGEIGSVVINGPNVFAGYLTEAHNAKAWVDRGDGLRWLNTGDLGRIDADGYLWLTGRKKELIIRGGQNIDPAQIEQPLYAHPAVKYAAAVARPDARLGELPVAYVQLKDGATVDEEELLKFVRERISERFAHPKAVHIVSQIPLTPVGKIFKPALQQREIESALSAALHLAGIPEARVRIDATPERPNHVIATIPYGADVEVARTALAEFPLSFALEAAQAPER